jgi:uncharacterized phage protein gp47/JayE
MTTPAPSWDDLYNDAKTEQVLRRPDLQVLDGDISDMILAGIAGVGDRVVGYTSDRIKATFVDGASGDDLTKLADDHWNITRVAAVQAVGTVSFSRASFAAGAGDVPAGTVVATQQDAFGREVRFTTGALAHFGATDLGPKTAPVTASVTGTAGNVAAATVNRVISTLFDGIITVTNAAITAGGAEAEADEDLRERIRAFTVSLRRGTLGALEFGAKQVSTVKQATAVEDSTGAVTVYVTDGSGASNAQMVVDVATELDNWRAAGSSVTVTGGQLYTLNPIEITLAVRTGVDTASIASTVKSAIKARIDRLKIGETCRREIISQAALNVDPDNITGCTVVLPAADVDPGDNQVIRTSTSYITVA